MLRKILLFPIHSFRWLAVRLIDGYCLWYSRWTARWDDRRDAAIKRLEERRIRQDMEIQMLRERHEREERRQKDELMIAAEQIKLLTADNQKFFEIIERDRAVLGRQTEEAKYRPPGGGAGGQGGVNMFSGQY